MPVKPCRVLVLADARARDGHVFRDAGELGDVLGLLSLWGVPHDMWRLDIQALREDSLVDAAGQPLYGVILWDVRTDLLARPFQEDAILRDACLKHHISLIALGGRINVPSVQETLGLRVRGAGAYQGTLAAGDSRHFITRTEWPLPARADEPWCASGPAIEPTGPDTKVLLRAGEQPLLTARDLDAATGTRAVWIGGDASCLLSGGGSGLGIRLFQRALVWSLGAMVVHDYNNALMLRMDDPGTAQSSYLRGWNYPSLSDSLIRQKILAPLREHHARLDAFCCPGYVDAKTRKILYSWQVDEIDAFGDREDLRDTFATMLEGQKEGLMEIECHGWTHMDPDLDSPAPGSTNWWAGSVSTEWADYTWYREFYDRRRNKDVAPDVQLQHMRISCDWLAGYYGRQPLAFCPPGHDVSGDFWVYPKGMTGTLDVRLEGAEPNGSYRLFLGQEPKWMLAGELHADPAGTINATLPAPPEIWMEGQGYFTINRIGGRTQFIAGSVHESLGFDFSLPVRDKVQMAPAEQREFPAASQSVCRGRITGHLNKETYQPPLRSSACTYQVAARAGFGLMIDTDCHFLDGQQVTTLRMVPVVSSPRGIEPAISCRDDVPTVFRFHNRDFILNPEFLVHALKSLDDQGPPPAYISADELAGYLHTRWTIRAGSDNDLVATVDLDAPSCRYLREHGSDWSLLATDEVVSAIGSRSGHIVVHVQGRMNQPGAVVRSSADAIQLHVPACTDERGIAMHAK